MGVGTFDGDRRLRRRARVHGLEPDLRQPRHGDRRATSSSTTRRQHDTTAKEFTFPIYADGRRTHPGAVAPATACRTASISSTPCARHPGHRAAARAEALRLLRQRSGSARRSAHRRAGAASTTRAASRSSRWCGRLLLSPQFKDPSNYYKRYSWPVEFVVRSLKEVGLERVLGERRADPADQHGAAAVRAARRQRLGARAGLVLERRHARADELRRAARDQPEVQPARPVARQRRLSGEPGVVHARSADAAGVRGATRTRRSLDYTRAGGAWTGSDTQLATKSSGLAHLIAGSGDYQLV